MARSVRVDHVQNFRFRVSLVPDVGNSLLLQTIRTALLSGTNNNFISFARVSTPSVNLETEEFKEGTWPFRRRTVVGATLDTVLLEKGVTTLPLVDTAMWMWAVGALQGEISRAALLVQLLARAQEPDRIRGTHRPIVAKEWVFHECIPVRMKLASDLDATDEDVSIAELEISANWVEQTPLETLASAGSR